MNRSKLTAREIRAMACSVRGARAYGDPDLLAATLARAEACLAKAEQVLGRLADAADCPGDDYIAQTGRYERAVRAANQLVPYAAAVEELRAALGDISHTSRRIS
jgi:hypothetical protein